MGKNSYFVLSNYFIDKTLGFPMYSKYILYFFLLFFLCQCHNKSSTDTDLLLKKDSNHKKQNSDTLRSVRMKEHDVARGPVINISDTILEKTNFLCIKDSAANQKILVQKLIYLHDTILANALLKYKLKSIGSPLAFYKKKVAPYFFEAGIPVNNKIKISSKTFYYKTLPQGKAIVAHFFGPKDLLNIAYGSLDTYITDQKLVRSGNSFEIYFPPAASKEKNNPYKQQTDIVIPVK